MGRTAKIVGGFRPPIPGPTSTGPDCSSGTSNFAGSTSSSTSTGPDCSSGTSNFAGSTSSSGPTDRSIDNYACDFPSGRTGAHPNLTSAIHQSFPTAKPTPAISPIPVSRGPVGLPPARPKPTQFEHSQLQPGTSAKPRVVAPPSRSPSPRYINRFAVLNWDEDADDADESPAPVNVDKGKGKEVVREAEKLPVVKVQRRKLANPKPALPWKTQEDVPEKTQGQAVPAPAKTQPDGEKKRPVPESSEIHRIPACKRCKRAKRNCVEQAGTGVACFGCAKLKMRCDPVSDDDEDDYDSRKPSLYPSGPSSQAIPAKRSAPDAVESSKPAKRPAQKKPAPKKKAAPVPASSQKNRPAKPRKPVKSPEYVDSTDEYEQDNAKVAVQGEIRRPKGRTLSDFEGYCGIFFFFYRKKLIN